MTQELRPLWQLLMETASQKEEIRPLTCSECFEILDYLAENLPRNEDGFQRDIVQQAAKRHLSTCPDCELYYLKRLQELEMSSKEDEKS